MSKLTLGLGHIRWWFSSCSVKVGLPCRTWPAINLNGIAYRVHVLIADTGTLLSPRSRTRTLSTIAAGAVVLPLLAALPSFISTAGTLTLIYRLVTFCEPKPKSTPHRNRSEPKVYANLANVLCQPSNSNLGSLRYSCSCWCPGGSSFPHHGLRTTYLLLFAALRLCLRANTSIMFFWLCPSRAMYLPLLSFALFRPL